MYNKVVFTICAKNYLAQALTLKESVLRHNNDVDFFIFLADMKDCVDDVDVIELDSSWIPDWVNMAYKYDVIEFNTSIKPFCFNKLFREGYEKVIYLDPDIYVTKSLDVVFDVLDEKSIMLTPHYCDIIEHFNGAVSESTFNCAGIYNLGFCALRNDSIGQEVSTWWMDRLQSSCYSDRSQGLFVDQKWMDYIPAFFPNETCISTNHGLNVAIWNLHERSLEIDHDGNYVIVRHKTNEKTPLVFFHFSGFDPFDNTVINRRHPQFNITTYPSFKPIIEEYRALVYKNGYDVYAKMTYSFNHYNDGRVIIPLHRRLFRQYIEDHKVVESPFDKKSAFVGLLSKKHLMLKANSKQTGFISYTKDEKSKGKRLETRIVQPLMKALLRLMGVEKYAMLVRMCELMGIRDYHYFLIK